MSNAGRRIGSSDYQLLFAALLTHRERGGEGRLDEHGDLVEAKIVAIRHQLQRQDELPEQEDGDRRGAERVAQCEAQGDEEREQTGGDRERGVRLRKIDGQGHEAEQAGQPGRNHEEIGRAHV